MASLLPAADVSAASARRASVLTPRGSEIRAFLDPFAGAQSVPLVALPRMSQALPPAESVEVTALWGDTVLSVAELTPPKRFAVGELGSVVGAGPAQQVDFALASERLGSVRREIIALRGGIPFAIFHGNEPPRVLENGQLVDVGSGIVDCPEVAPGARGIALRQGRVVLVEWSGVTFRLAGGAKLDRMPRVLLETSDRSALAALSAAAIVQGLVVATLAYLTPSMVLADDDGIDRDRIALMQQYLHASAERQRQEEPQSRPEAGEKGAPAERNRGPEGKAGSALTVKQTGRMAIQGDSALRAVSRAEVLQEATNFGTIGLLNAMNAANAPSSAWGSFAMGPDSVNFAGDLFSANIAESAGSGGLSLSGREQGGGSKGVGVAMGDIGTCLGLNCYGRDGGTFARSSSLSQRGHESRAPRIASAPPTLSGHLPPDVIQRIVRQNFGRFRQCYELGLRTNPGLEGRVTLRFVIGRDGAVSNVSTAGDLPDAGVRSCMAGAFYGLSFPSPDAGIVTVNYPIVLTPG